MHVECDMEIADGAAHPENPRSCLIPAVMDYYKTHTHRHTLKHNTLSGVCCSLWCSMCMCNALLALGLLLLQALIKHLC